MESRPEKYVTDLVACDYLWLRTLPSMIFIILPLMTWGVSRKCAPGRINAITLLITIVSTYCVEVADNYFWLAINALNQEHSPCCVEAKQEKTITIAGLKLAHSIEP